MNHLLSRSRPRFVLRIRIRAAHAGKLLATVLVGGALGLTGRPATAEVITGLTAYWNFDDTLEDQAPAYAFTADTVPDDGMFSSEAAGFDAGLFGQAYRGVGGSDGYVIVSASDDVSGLVTGSVTVSFWFQAVGPTSTWQAAVALGEGQAWRVARGGANTPFQMSYAGGAGDIYSATTFGTPEEPVAQWNHVAVVTEAGVSTRLYINGVLEATGGVPSLADNGSSELWIGGNPQASGRAWNGFLDDMAIWNRALPVEEIVRIANEGRNNGKSLADLLAVDATDTDGDGLPNSWEIAHLPAGAHLDNGSVNPQFGAAGDPDGDSSSNLEEFQRGTDPQNADTDGDGLQDGVETGTGVWVSVTNTGTDPLRADTDGDGLSDGVENPSLPYNPAQAATQPGTSPLNADTDGDGFPDGIEIVYGSNPTLAGSVPSGGSLPIADTFDDGVLDMVLWNTDLNVPAAGAGVVEQNGRLALIGRGHLFTREEIDPVALGGIFIAGKWTFQSTDDFLQILTRSDAVPAGQYGETQEGVEFYASQTDNSMNIQIRGTSFSVDNPQSQGSVALLSGRTYVFTVVDDGEGGLSFWLSEEGNPANGAVRRAVLDAFVDGPNHIVFHNREGGRTSHLEEVLIAKLDADTDGDGMPDFWEIAHGLDRLVNDAALDLDSDGLSNVQEYQRGLHPGNPDTDGDGLADGVEDNGGVYVGPQQTGSNPLLWDTDGDGMGDGDEVALGRNPVNSDDAATGLGAGLTAYWNFDGILDDIAHLTSIGESTVADHGHFTGAPDVDFTSEAFLGSGALTLNGGSGWVTVPRSVDTIGNLTTRNVSVALWLKAEDFSSTWQAAIAHGEGSRWRIARQGDTVPPGMAYAGGVGDIYSTTTFTPPTDWYHVVAVTEHGVATSIYINGALETTGGIPNLDIGLAAAPDLFIGANPQAADREWNGLIDDAAIWTRVLTGEEITSLYQAGLRGESLGHLLGAVMPASIKITAVAFDAATRQVTLTWTSTEGETYGIAYSANLAGWGQYVIESLPAAAGSATTTYTFALPAAVSDAATLFFRVEAK